MAQKQVHAAASRAANHGLYGLIINMWGAALMGSEDVKCLPIPLSHGLSHSLKIACTQIFFSDFPAFPAVPHLAWCSGLKGKGEANWKTLGTSLAHCIPIDLLWIDNGI